MNFFEENILPLPPLGHVLSTSSVSAKFNLLSVVVSSFIGGRYVGAPVEVFICLTAEK